MQAEPTIVEYYNNDFDWKTLEEKYKSVFDGRDESIENNDLDDYEQSWESFYKANQENFFKDRKYLMKSFEEIGEIIKKSSI